MNRRNFITKATMGLLSIPVISNAKVLNFVSDKMFCNNNEKQNIDFKYTNNILQYARTVKVPKSFWHQYEGKNFTKLG